MAKKKDTKTTKAAKPEKAKADKPAKAKKGGKGGGFDSAKMKEFAINYGEKIGLGVAALLMLIFFLYGISLALTARSPHKEIQQAATTLGGRIQSSEPDPSIAR